METLQNKPTYDYFELHTTNPSPIIHQIEALGGETLHGGNSNGLRRLLIKIKKGEALKVKGFKMTAVDQGEWFFAKDMSNF